MCQFQLGPEYTIKYMPIQVLSMRGKDGVGAVAELMSDIWSLLPEPQGEEASKDDMLFRDDTEGQGMEFVKEDTGAVMQSLHLKAIGAMLINTATTIHRSPEALNFKLKLDAPS
ncbi:unnamed protein product [Musa acuminata subsp. malaccensis]|uniref:(wild Malaysian banana) hypothetical protein n=1 Tax=Musa acuminata subsp. malaccensis TaxID=214687 RepID=A0A804HLW2_MUSAM|nr:PREDICTED: uncharacterized protein LOC103978362 isoform X1 [Musa acuminata subsp. malaccensis]CAG1850373.1 unnamed protein product [Musa acuminata subsp. malaccensis]